MKVVSLLLAMLLMLSIEAPSTIRIDPCKCSGETGAWVDQGGGINWRHWKCVAHPLSSECIEYDWMTWCQCPMPSAGEPTTILGPNANSQYFDTWPELNSDGEYQESGIPYNEE